MTLIFWIISGLMIAAILIVLACVRAGSDREHDIDPYNGDGF